MKKIVIILAGGSGSRMNASVNKILLPLCGKAVICRSIEAFLDFADEIVIVIRPEDQSDILAAISRINIPVPVRFVPGGISRQGSVLNGLQSVKCNPDDVILIHDAARCLVDRQTILHVINSVKLYGTGVPAIPVTSTYKIIDNESYVLNTPERTSLYEIQTPQGFTAGMIIPLSVKAAEEKYECTDDAGVLEHYQIPVKIVPGKSSNIKLTSPDDIARAESFLKGANSSMRIGMGYDVHRLIKGRKLILCGVEIPYEFGLLGHSDADVALHALMDAMLGACALGDIGQYFPDTEERYRGISSACLLNETVRILNDAGYRVNNADITIVAQKPKLAAFVPDMVSKVSSALEIDKACVSIKATTTEKLGFEGRMEGISAYAVCTVVDRKEEYESRQK